MKKVVFVVVVVVLMFGFLLGRVSAKNDWECLYGDCGKDGFVVMQKGKSFIMGNVLNSSYKESKVKEAVMKDEKSNFYSYYLNHKSYAKINQKSIAFGDLGLDKYKNPCIYKGYVFSWNLKDYENYKDKGCEPLGEK